MIALALAAMTARGATAASAQRTLKAIHERVGGRLGVHILDSQSGKRIGLDDGSRYAMASTFKVPLAAALLWQVDHGAFRLDHELSVDKSDLVANSPEIEARVAAGVTSMSIRDLCGSAVVLSDNAAANVLLKGIGGPPGFTSFMRSIGDEVTRLDRTEPDLNSNTSGDPRDSTTPRAMVDSMLRIFTQEVLSLSSRALLIDWMTASHTGRDRVRAGIPKAWPVGDKTGTGQNGAFNDIVIAYPPKRRPIFIAVYMSESKLAAKELAAAHADIGTIVAREDWP